MNFYEDGTPVGFGLLKTAAAPAFLGKAIGAGAKALSGLGMKAAKMIGKGGKKLQGITAGGKFAQQGHKVGGMMRDVGTWAGKGNNALKLGGGIAAGGALAAGAGGLALANRGQQQPQQQQNQQQYY